jgi:hypothetical protein
MNNKEFLLQLEILRIGGEERFSLLKGKLDKENKNLDLSRFQIDVISGASPRLRLSHAFDPWPTRRYYCSTDCSHHHRRSPAASQSH